jgi:hypothetical protein
MKKAFSISLSLLMLTAMLHLSVATHYCGGREVATKLSFTGKPASCGMESSEKEIPLTGAYFSTHCCDNIITSCGIDNNYEPSFSFIPESYQFNFQVLSLPLELSVNSITDLITSNTYVSPPGVLMSTNVDLSDICVFRI